MRFGEIIAKVIWSWQIFLASTLHCWNVRPKQKQKKIKDIDKKMVTKNSNHKSKYWGYNENFCLMIWKGVYPYEFLGGWKNFEESKLSPKIIFYSKLSMKGISDNDYGNTQQVWNTVEKKTLDCHHDTYLKIDVYQFGDVFEAFWNMCLKKVQFRSSTCLHSTWISMVGLVKDSFRVLWTWSKA